MRRIRAALVTFLFLLVCICSATGAWLRAKRRHYALNRQLIAALELNDVKQALELVNAGADPNTHLEPPPEPSFEVWKYELLNGSYPQIDHFCTAFALACGVGCNVPGSVCVGRQQRTADVQLIQTMLAHGADPNASVQIDGPVINIAAFLNHERVAELLVAHGANVNYYGGGTGTPLLSAIRNHNSYMVQLLLRHGADPNLAYKGQTPLRLARQCARPEIAALLRRYGARDSHLPPTR